MPRRGTRSAIFEMACADLPLIKGQNQGRNIADKTLQELLPHTPNWAIPYFDHYTYKAVHSGRAGGKSHFFAELMLARMVKDPDLQCVVIRKYRQSITNSVQLLLKNKIGALGWGAFFDTQGNVIKRIGGSGFIAFKGMQDHNAESIKSFENFGIAWVEEATEIDQYSLELLIPTIRANGSELWFTWNPDQPIDPVDAFFRKDPPKDALVTQIDFRQNPFLTEKSKQDEKEALERDPEKHDWIWLGGYNVKSDALIFSGCWRVESLDEGSIAQWDGPYFGGDWGFATDPTVAVQIFIVGDIIYFRRESYKYRLPLDSIAQQWKADIPGIEKHLVKADSSRPDTIDHVRKKGIPRLIGCTKGTGSVENGIEWMKSKQIIVHPSCENTILEFKRYRYKQNKAGEVLPEIIDKDNHAIDSGRYALEGLIKNRGRQYGESRAYW